MVSNVIATTILALLLACAASAQPQLTPAPAGPFHVAANQIVDVKGHTFLMRGTQLPEFRLDAAASDASSGIVFGPHSATSLAAIRLRFNMNTVRLPVNVQEGSRPGYFAELAKLVQRANESELLVLIAAHEPDANLPSSKTVEFWTRCAAYFKDYPNVMLDAFSDPSAASVSTIDVHSPEGWKLWRQSFESLVHAIRSAGAHQPIVAMSWKDDRMFEGAGATPLLNDSNIIYDAARDAHFGFLARRAPVLANGWDLELENTAACSALPSDPSAAGVLVQANLDYFDTHRISWTVSVFEPGKLVKDLAFHDATQLDNGWTCGHPTYPQAGLGRLIEAHMRGTEERGFFVVSAAGGPDLPRGGFAIAYGPVLAERDSHSAGLRLPLSLGKLSVEVIDVRGVTRRAGIFGATAGWGQVNFVIPADSAPGPGSMTVVRADGSRSSAKIMIADTAPGFWARVSCRGPAQGTVVRVFANGRTAQAPLSSCEKGDCKTVPIVMTSGAVTRVRLEGSGFRYARSAANIELTIGGIRVPVVSFGAARDAGMDQVTVEIPASLRGLGETDVVCRLNGRVSNPVRIRIG
jgi:uncharacterized protein (TIGR03437 family)